MNKKVIIELTDDEHRLLLTLLNYEWDEEVEYQLRNSMDVFYLKDMLHLYKACLGKENNVFESFVHKYDIDDKIKDIKEIMELQNE